MNTGRFAASVMCVAVLHVAALATLAQPAPPTVDAKTVDAKTVDAKTVDAKTGEATVEATTRPAAEPIADLQKQLKLAIAESRFTDALALMDRLEPALKVPDYYVASNRFRVLIKSRRYDEAYRYMGKVENLPDVTANLLNELALIITDTKDVEERDLIAAKRLARHALALSDDWPGFTNTLARAYFVNGEYERAVEAERDAIERAPEQWKAEFTRTLQKYQAALAASRQAV